MNTEILNVELFIYDDGDTTAQVTAKSNNNTVVFYVQTIKRVGYADHRKCGLDTEYLYDLSKGCYINTDHSEDIDKEDYPDFDFTKIIESAENFITDHKQQK